MTNDYPSSLSSFAAASILDRAARTKAGAAPPVTPEPEPSKGRQRREFARATRGVRVATTFPNTYGNYSPALAEAKRRERAKHTFWTLTPAERFARLAAAFQAFAGTRRGAVA